MAASDALLIEELTSVDSELAAVQLELDALLQRQEDLLERKSLLTSQLESLQQESKTQQLQSTSSEDWEEGEFPWTPQAESALRSQFKIQSFRPLQRSCINATLSGRDAILIMPTGGGKSLCYQLPAVLSEGLTLIVSPLVSLMEDQLLATRNLGIESHTLNASTSREDVNAVHAQMTTRGSGLKLLYVTPEKLSKSKRFMSKLEKAYESGLLSRIVIDEVHCASQWGHDFRPDYKILGILKRQFPSVPVLGTTATATSRVLQDVKQMLGLGECLVFRSSYNRENLFYEVRLKSGVHKSQMDAMAALIKRKFAAASGIVYCFSRKETEDVASGLCEKGIRAAHYHADLPASQRSSVHMRWLGNSIQVIVATVAFGMGIDKPDVRFVIHHSVSKSMENYYQESGRAGRDGQPAHCILFFRAADAYRQSTMVFTERTGLQNLYAMLCYCLNQADCRRSVIARSFGEHWDPSDCKGSCDVCSLHPLSSDVTESSRDGPESSQAVGFVPKKSKLIYTCTEEDVSAHCATLLSIVEGSRDSNKRLTALKVVEMWRERLRKGPSPEGAKKLSTEDCENILLEAVLAGVLKEEFHFTPYSTISYIGVGQKAGAVRRGTAKVKIRKRVASGNWVGSSSGGGGGGSKSADSVVVNKPVVPVADRVGSSEEKAKTKGLSAAHGDPVRSNTFLTKRKSLPPRPQPQSPSISKEQQEESKDDCDRSSAVKRKLPRMLLSSSLSSEALSDELDFLPLRRKRVRTEQETGCVTSSQGKTGSGRGETGSGRGETGSGRGKLGSSRREVGTVIEIDSD